MKWVAAFAAEELSPPAGQMHRRKEKWWWPMAAQKRMERETVVSLKVVQDLFNKFFRDLLA